MILKNHTPILDIKDYVDNYINNEEINNDFYENFSWF